MPNIERWLVEDWRDITHWWSAWTTVIGGVIAALLSAMPVLPPEIQAAIPVKYRVAVVAICSIMSLVARAAKQPQRP